MPLTYEGQSPSGGLGWAGTSAVAFFFFFFNRATLQPASLSPSPSSVCQLSFSKILHPHHPHRCYSASISFPLSPLTSFFAEPESGSWYVSWTLLTTICFGVGLVVCCHPLSLGNRCSVSLYFMVSPFALENDKGSLLI